MEKKILNRLDFQELCKRVPLSLPDYGEIKVFPYISSGAMTAASIAYPEGNMLEAILRSSVEEGISKIEVLSIRDWETIARHFIQAVHALDEFEAQTLAGKATHEAFELAFIASHDWIEAQESNERMRRALERQIAPTLRLADSYQRQFKALQLSVQIPELKFPLLSIHDRFFDPLENALKSLNVLKEISLPKFDVPKFALTIPGLDSFRQVERQLAGIRLIHEKQLSSLSLFSDLAKRPLIADFSNIQSLVKLNESIGKTVQHAMETNNYFSASDYLSPRRIRTVAIRPGVDSDWIDELEETEQAIVLETLTNQQTIDSIVQARLEQFSNDHRLDELPELRNRLASLDTGEELSATLNRFALRVARDDHRIFWSDYGEKFNASPESIGKALLGSFLVGHARGQGFVAHEIAAGEGFVDIVVFFNQRTYVLELKVIGCGWGIGKAKLGLEQLEYYDSLIEDPEIYLVVFDGRKSSSGEQLLPEYELSNGKKAQVIHVPIYSAAPTAPKAKNHRK